MSTDCYDYYMFCNTNYDACFDEDITDGLGILDLAPRRISGCEVEGLYLESIVWISGTGILGTFVNWAHVS